ERTAAAVDDLEWRRNQNRPGRRQLIKIAQACQPELAGAVHRRVIGKGRSESAGLTRVRSNRLDADTKHIAILGEHLRRARIKPRAVRTVVAGIDERCCTGPAAPS